MADRPILFSAQMVRALLDGSKTQTRRRAKFVSREPGLNMGFSGLHASQPRPGCWVLLSKSRSCWEDRTQMWRCPYGVPGDTLWVRETLKWNDADAVWQYGADAANVPELSLLCRPTPTRWPKGVCVSMWMPRGASRIALDITNVRVERLQDISESDAQAEGCARLVMDDDGKCYESERGTYRTGYAGLWDHINGAGAWDANPWVVALSFEIRTVNAAETGSAALEPVA